MNNLLNPQPAVGSVIMKLFKRRKTYRFFLRSGEHFDVRGTDVEIEWKKDHSEYTQFTVENTDRFIHCLVPQIVAVVEVK